MFAKRSLFSLAMLDRRRQKASALPAARTFAGMLMAEGVARVFHPGCSQADIVGGIADLIVERRKTLGE